MNRFFYICAILQLAGAGSCLADFASPALPPAERIAVMRPNGGGSGPLLRTAVTQSFVWTRADALSGFSILMFGEGSTAMLNGLRVTGEIHRLEAGDILGETVASQVFSKVDLFGGEYGGALTLPNLVYGGFSTPVSLERGGKYALRLIPNQDWMVLSARDSLSGSPTDYLDGRLLEGGYIFSYDGVDTPLDAAANPRTDLLFRLYSIPEPSAAGLCWMTAAAFGLRRKK